MVRAQLRPLLDSNKNNYPLSTWEGPELVREIEWEWAEVKAYRDAQRIVIQRKDEPRSNGSSLYIDIKRSIELSNLYVWVN